MRVPIRITPAEAEAVALKAFLFLAADDERLHWFVNLSGFDVSNARDAVTTRGFLPGVLAYYLNDEEAIVAFSDAENMHPLSIALAYRVIPGGDPALEINTGY